MKATNIITTIALCLSITSAYGQLKVKTNGDVKIGSGTGYPSGGDLEIVEINQTTEARIFAASPDIARLWTLNSMGSYGFGVDVNGIGKIYTNINGPQTIMSFNGTGNFGINRPVNLSYALDILGSLRVNSTVYTSDQRFKSNVVNIGDRSTGIMLLRGVSYNWNEESGMDKMWRERIQFGFIAQEVKKVYPNLVHEDSLGVLAVDYIGFIPLIVEGYKDQQNTISQLESEIQMLKSTLVNFEDENARYHLEQNKPNPFSDNTIIEYTIEGSYSKASIMMCDMQGILVTSYDLVDRLGGKIEIERGQLKPGMYLYSLIVDDQIKATKRMILSE